MVAGASGGRFRFYPVAVAGERGVAVFHESLRNVSGSLSGAHRNVRRDPVVSYRVECVTLAQIRDLIGGIPVDLLKLDVEGAEYGILGAAGPEELRSIEQIVVEFHHGTIEGITRADTERAIGKLRACGFEVYTRDRANYLFWRREKTCQAECWSPERAASSGTT